MPTPVFGTAHLFGLVDADASGVVLDAAWEHGFRAFDTAPLYGHGRSEAELGTRLTGWRPRPRVTTKVGLEAAPPPPATVRVAKAAARRLPGSLQRRLRPGGTPEAPHGSFDADLVRWSLDRSVLRLGRIDRLMLHEAHADDLTDELVELLTTSLARGDVGQIGVATGNAAAGAVARRAPGLITAAHVEVGPFAPAADLPASVTTVVGHGVLGAGGTALRTLLERVRADRVLTDRIGSDAVPGDSEATRRWVEVTADTRWAGDAGLAAALVARAAALPLSDVIVATSRPERLAALHELAAGDVPLPPEVAAALAALVAACTDGVS